MRYITRPLSVWTAQIRNSITRDLMFHNNFLLWVVVEIFWMALQFVFIEVIYGHVDSIAGWTKYQMLLLLGTHYLIMNLFQTFFMTNITEIPELVRTGRLDFFLMQPVDVQFLLSTRKFDLSCLVNSFVSIGLCVYACVRLQLIPDFSQILFFAVCVLAGIGLHYAILLAGVTFSFWITKTEGIIYGYYQLMTIARIPRDAFRGLWKIVFSFLIPVLLIANVPATSLLGSSTLFTISILITASLTAILLASLFFHKGLGNYRSASS